MTFDVQDFHAIAVGKIAFDIITIGVIALYIMTFINFNK